MYNKICNKIQYLLLRLSGWIMSNKHKFIFARYGLFILACHDSCISWTEIRRNTYYFDATCLRRQLKMLMNEQNVFHMTHILPISRLKPIEYVYPKLSNATAYNQSKQAVMSASTILRQYTLKLRYSCN